MAVVTITIKSEQQVLPAEFELLSIDVSKEFNKIPLAELKLIDGNVAKQEFNILDSGYFEPGRQIDIALKYEGDPAAGETVFSGIVTNQGLELNQAGTTLVIELSDKALAMTQARHNAVYTNLSDSSIIEKLVAENKLQPANIAPTPATHAEMIQYYATDWDFILSRLEANGQLLLADDGKITTMPPAISTPAVSLELGIDTIYNFDLQAGSRNQVQEVATVSWDPAKQQLTTPAKGQDFVLPQGNYNVAGLAKSAGGAKVTLVHPVPLDAKERKSWADAQVIKSRLSLIRGWICVPGTTKIKVGQTIEIKGVGKRFTGRNIVSGIRHQVTTANWLTHIQIGMDAGWFTARTAVTDSKAAGLLPGINGLQVALVAAYEDDPENQSRVKVHIPALGSNAGAVWARLATLDAGKERGVFFRPEAGDEVIVGFMNDDPRQAIILGSLHSSANKTPITISSKNSRKGIVTKSKYQLLFDEEQETITLSTSLNNSICIDEKNGLIRLNDANGNQVELGSQGVLINSAKDCKINTVGNFEITAGKNITIKGKKVDLT